ncbi:MAG: sodium-dependent transporter [Clostridia bacterium]|nr:sodium-dependent transporter [Clostridia bacterium]
MELSEKERNQWGSKLGFLLAAIGSAVGLGNIWGFPYKMGATGGFGFLLVYVILAVLVGVVMLSTELAIGRKTQKSPVLAYREMGKGPFKFLGWLAVLSPFVIIFFYFVLGGYCLEYMTLNLSEIGFFDGAIPTGDESFGPMLTNPVGCIIFAALFVAITLFINGKDLTAGIERFSEIGMPALVVLLFIIIIRSVSLDGAAEGLEFMFKPDWSQFDSFGKVIHVLAVSGSQMFFSLSLAMGIMITYGSYLPKHENIVKSSVIIVVCDTLVAIMAGLAVIPASFALGGSDAAMAGPKLLFVTMQNVFSEMGQIGAVFGVLFYLFVIIAALSSCVSIFEVLLAYICDDREAKGKPADRTKVTWTVGAIVSLGAILVAADGLGSNGLWLPLQEQLGVLGFNDCWLDFFDCLSEGIMMPLGACLMAVLIGWVIKPKSVLGEIGAGDKYNLFYKISIKFICPVVMFFVLLGQISSFFGLGWFE